MRPGYSVFLLSLRHSALIAFAAVFFLLWSPWVRAQGDNLVVTHIVEAGETLSSIAQRYGTDVVELKRANGLTATSLLVGQRLSIPRPASESGALAAFGDHEVAVGETLSDIARHYGVDELALYAVNYDLIEAGVPPGATLRVPPAQTGSMTLMAELTRSLLMFPPLGRIGLPHS